MLTIDYENFVQNKELVFREIARRREEAAIEIKGLGVFRVCYQDQKLEEHKVSLDLLGTD